MRNWEPKPLQILAALLVLQLFVALFTDGFALSFDEAMWHYIGRNWFRRMVWRPSCAAAGLSDLPRFHDLRHSHASWLPAGGADLQVVKERLGHASIMTTQCYLHTLPEADEAAIGPSAASGTGPHQVPGAAKAGQRNPAC